MVRGRTLKPTSVDDRARFVLMWVDGVSARDIAVATGASVSTVYRWIRRWQRDGSVDSRRRRYVSLIMPGIKDPVNIQATNSPLLTTPMDVDYSLHTHRRTNIFPRGFQEKKENCYSPAYIENVDLRKRYCDPPYNLGYTDVNSNLRGNISVNEPRNSLPVPPGVRRWFGPHTT